MTAPATTSAGRRRSVLPWAALAAVLVLLAVVVGRDRSAGGRPLGPDSTGPDGAHAVVQLLGAYAGTVDVIRGAPSDDTTSALLLDDRLSDADVDDLERWVERGGTLVVADRASSLADDFTGDDACPAAFADVEVLVFVDGERTVDGAAPCADAGLVARPRGDGWVVSVDGPGPFTNALLDEGDNSVLAVAAVAPTGAERVAFVDGGVGSGGDDLVDLVPTSTRQAIVQLGIAFVLLVLWAGRRLGRPVLEPQPVAVEGAELVAATGRLLDGRRRPAEAAVAVRAATRRTLERRLGLPANAPVRVVAAAVHAQSGLAPDRVEAAIATQPVTTDTDLVALTAELDHIRRTTLGGEA
jgi:Domain of unknown function (DUF4350)